ncbi:hypothetical protein TIFTF001_033286 [Ficus carica]|uniref:Uncharacterized protein n=1 Tax=Ficus carica TaxID=3494 RepID=A0AA88DXY3_FICCA|nr:hypothetical protein TIFTF001_033286 [Ficus carica]
MSPSPSRTNRKNSNDKKHKNHDGENRSNILLRGCLVEGGKIVIGKSRSPPRNGEIASEIPTRSRRQCARSPVVFSTPSKPSSPISSFARTKHVVFFVDSHLCGGFGGLGI